MEDQFGAWNVVFKGAQFICAPAKRESVGITPPTTTTTLPPQPCRFTDGQCQGQCSAGGVCSAAASSGSGDVIFVRPGEVHEVVAGSTGMAILGCQAPPDPKRERLAREAGR